MNMEEECFLTLVRIYYMRSDSVFLWHDAMKTRLAEAAGSDTGIRLRSEYAGRMP